LIADAAEQGVALRTWKSISPKYGWSLRLKQGRRTIFYLSPCKECFRVVLILGDKAVAAAQKSNLSKSIHDAINQAPRHTEGTGLRIMVSKPSDLPAIRRLIAVKLAN
jgi:hypothetical protein